MLIASPMPLVPPVTIATRAMILSFCLLLWRGPYCAAQPTFKLAGEQGAQHRHAVVAVVEAGQIGEIAAAGGEEGLAAANRQLLQRLQAIGGEARREDRDPGDALARAARPASCRSPAPAIWRGRSATGRRPISSRPSASREQPRGLAGNGNDRDRRARGVRSGMPWKLAMSACGSKSSSASAASTLCLRARRYRAGSSIIRRQRADRRLPAQPAQDGRRRRRARSRSSPRNIADRAARSGCARSPRALQRVDPLADRRPAVAHRMIDRHVRPERAVQRLRLARVIAASGEPSSVQTCR